MNAKHTLLIFFYFACLSCCTPQIKTQPKTDSPWVFGITMNNDTIKAPEVVVVKKPNAVWKSVNKFSPHASVVSTPKSHFTNYSTEQGLVLSSITSCCYDKAGNLWFGTQGGGVSRYDGSSFVNFSTQHGLANNDVISILEDKNGNLWFGTEGGGVSKYDGRSFTNFTAARGLAGDLIYSIAEDKLGNIWFGTYKGGVSKYNGKSFTNYTTSQGLAANNVFSALEDRYGNMWFGTQGGGLSKYDGKSFKNFRSGQGQSENTVLCMIEDKNGTLWLGTYAGVSKYDGKSFTSLRELSNLKIASIAEDDNGDLWFGTVEGGVSKYDGKSFTNFTTDQGLADNTVLSIGKDKTGNLWFCTQGGGVSKYAGSAFSYFPGPAWLPGTDLRTVEEDENGALWFGAEARGASKYDGKTFTHYRFEPALENDDIFCITKDKSGNLWLGTYGNGTNKYDGKTFINFNTKDGLINDAVLCTAQDRAGNLWIGTYDGGVSKYNGKSFTNFTTQQGLANNSVFFITEDKRGNIWFATQGGGLSKYNGKYFTNFTESQGLADNNAISMTEDKNGNLWIGTENGLSVLTRGELTSDITPPKKGVKNNPEEGYRIKNYSVINGLPDNYITQALQLPNGKIVVGTNVGLAVFNPTLPLEPNGKLAELEIFNSSTGYPIKDINVCQKAMFLDSKGIVWAGTGEEKIGVVRFDYNAVNHQHKAPNVVIQNIKLNEETVCYYSLDPTSDSTVLAQQEILTYHKVLSLKERDSIQQKFEGVRFDSIASFYPIPKNLILPYNHNNITIQYNCVEVGRPFMVNYQCMLEGYDEDWSPISKKQEASYGNINEGTYTFKLRVQSPEGIWSEINTYTFTVLPPWWRTWWMYIIYGLLIVACVTLIVWWNGRTLKARADYLDAEVKKATVVITKQKEIVEEQKKVVEEKHKEITDSINYAERIQKALLASKKMLDENLSDYFVLFKPKDVVSGDFYWATKLKNQHFILVTADSTGHGVPGAIMSILNISCLEKAVEVEKLSAPNDILNHTRTKIIETLKRDGSNDGGKDGMDGSLLSFDFKNNQLSCASANNPVWIIRAKPSNDSGYELIEIKGDKMPIGKHEKDHLPFTLHTMALQKGDLVYTLTDGYPDQFGGEKGKKFMSKRLQELLLTLAHEPMALQHQKLNESFNTWKRNLEQVDDVCLIGVRV